MELHDVQGASLGVLSPKRLADINRPEIL